jgi:5-methylcytosine-specific restriction endonuclease McrA
MIANGLYKLFFSLRDVDRKTISRKEKNGESRSEKRRRIALILAKPSWLTQEQKKQIKDIYVEAKRKSGYLPYRVYHVDHIIPLQGNDVCGLHVPWNLQILSAEDNLRKSNKHYSP